MPVVASFFSRTVFPGTQVTDPQAGLRRKTLTPTPAAQNTYQPAFFICFHTRSIAMQTAC